MHSLRGFAAYLWVRNGRDNLKRALLANAYEEVTHQNLAQLPEDGTLYRAMVD